MRVEESLNRRERQNATFYTATGCLCEFVLTALVNVVKVSTKCNWIIFYFNLNASFLIKTLSLLMLMIFIYSFLLPIDDKLDLTIFLRFMRKVYDQFYDDDV